MKKIKLTITSILLILGGLQAYGNLPGVECILSDNLQRKLNEEGFQATTLEELAIVIDSNYNDNEVIGNIRNILNPIRSGMKIDHLQAFLRTEDKRNWAKNDEATVRHRLEFFKNGHYWVITKPGNEANQAEGYIVTLVPALETSLKNIKNRLSGKEYNEWLAILKYVEGLGYTRHKKDLAKGAQAYLESIKLSPIRHKGAVRHLLTDC